MRVEYEKALKNVVSRVLNIVPYDLLYAMAGNQLTTVYYHMISDDEVLHIKNLYPYKNRDLFRRDIEFFQKNFCIIALNDLLDHLDGKRSLPHKSLLLTFDDGFSEMATTVAPFLVEKGLPAVFFLTTSILDNAKLYFRHKASILADIICKSKDLEMCLKDEISRSQSIPGATLREKILSASQEEESFLDAVAARIGCDFNDYLNSRKPYLSTEQVQWLLSNGFEIGAHSLDHPLYSDLPLEEQLRQTLESMRYIRERFNLSYGAFAFPHNDHGVSLEFFSELARSGLVDVSFGTAGIRADTAEHNIQRISMETLRLPAKQILARQFGRSVFLKKTGKSRIIRS